MDKDIKKKIGVCHSKVFWPFCARCQLNGFSSFCVINKQTDKETHHLIGIYKLYILTNSMLSNTNVDNKVNILLIHNHLLGLFYIFRKVMNTFQL